MTKTDNDKLLQNFFAENKQEIADNGFSHRVMHHLPNRSNRLIYIWNSFITAIGVVLFYRLGGFEAVWKTIWEVFVNMINHGTTHPDPQSLIIAGIVLMFMATKKIASLA